MCHTPDATEPTKRWSGNLDQKNTPSTLIQAVVYQATIEMALCADQEPASSPPVRGTHQEKMKAPRQEASSHYRLSVNSTQAAVGQIRVEFGWRAVLKRDDSEVQLKEIVPSPRDPNQKEKMTCPPLA